MTYYLKYRSKDLDEIDLEDVRVSLEEIVRSGNIPHALLFLGPKGTGKTSAARIIAKIVNCENPPAGGEPCSKCSQCISIARGENLDVLELDAASHRGIDDIRTLREAVKLTPAKANKKIYIVDEAHMLTLEASNALLKTLEEPPEHVMFILATTNPEKLIATIRSRATNIVFNKAKISEIVRSLQRVVKGEKLKVEKGVLELIAGESDGSFRDAIKTLEQLVSEKIKLNQKDVGERLMQKNIFVPEEFLDILVKKDVKMSLKAIDKYIKSGVSVRFIISRLSLMLREYLVKSIIGEEHKVISLSRENTIYLIELLDSAYLQVAHSVMEQIPLELAVIRWCDSNVKDENSLRAGDSREPEAKAENINENTLPGKKKETIFTGDKKLKSIDGGVSCLEDTVWAQILSLVRPRNASTEALLRASKPIEYDGKVLKLGVYYKFHKEHLESSPHIGILEKVIEEVLGSCTRVICVLTDAPVKKQEVVVNEEHIGNNSILPDNGDIDLESATTDVVLTESKDENIIKVAKEIFES